MIVQISMVRNEKKLIQELLPVWKSYADGFVFLLHNNTDTTEQFLEDVKSEYNILEVLKVDDLVDKVTIETDLRQLLFNTGRKYSDKIICLDADEYLDGTLTKEDLFYLFEQNPNTVFYLKWLQYTSVDTIRVDGPWKNNYKDRLGTYSNYVKFIPAQNHSHHLPHPENILTLEEDTLRIVHLHWMDKTYAGIKQYYWKVLDFVNKKKFNVNTIPVQAYDDSVNNFQWEEEYTSHLLKVKPWIVKECGIIDNYRLPVIKNLTRTYDIPNLGDWGIGILDLENKQEIPDNRLKVSVITAIGPLFIYEKFIPRFYENILQQHLFQETEHIIVYSEWSKHFDIMEQYDNIRFIKEDNQLGVYNAWNIGIKACTTEFITNWNIDDLRHPVNTKLKFDVLSKNSYIDLVHNWYVATQRPDETYNNITYDDKTVIQYPDNYHTKVLEGCFTGPDPMWRKSLHDKVGYFDYENFNTIGDWEMWIRFAKQGAIFKLIPHVLCLYLDHTETVSQRQQDKVQLEKYKLLEKYGN